MYIYRPWGKKPFPWRTILAAVGLFTLGTILLVRGVNEVTYYDGERGRSMILLGSICFISSFDDCFIIEYGLPTPFAQHLSFVLASS